MQSSGAEIYQPKILASTYCYCDLVSVGCLNDNYFHGRYFVLRVEENIGELLSLILVFISFQKYLCHSLVIPSDQEVILV